MILFSLADIHEFVMEILVQRGTEYRCGDMVRVVQKKKKKGRTRET